MSNPNALFDGQAETIDPNVGNDGTVYLKAAGRSISVAGASDPSAPQLSMDASKLIGFGGQVVAAGPTRTALRSVSTPARRITVKALVGNSNTLYVGDVTVTANVNNTTGGFQLSPGESFTFGIDDVADVYIHGTAGEGCSFAYEE